MVGRFWAIGVNLQQALLEVGADPSAVQTRSRGGTVAAGKRVASLADCAVSGLDRSLTGILGFVARYYSRKV